jgi:hypothetical protein
MSADIVTVITRPDAFTDGAMARRAREASGPGLQDTAGAGRHFRRGHLDVMSGKADAAFFASLPENITPSTDDNPFFFYTARFRDLLDQADVDAVQTTTRRSA